MLDYEKMDVYKASRELSREICRLMKLLRLGRADLKDQVLRSNASIPLNISEGSGEFTPGRKCYFYRIAKSSATECNATLDHMVDHELLDEREVTRAKDLLERIVGMLIKLIASVEGRSPKKLEAPLRPRRLGTKKPLIPRHAAPEQD